MKGFKKYFVEEDGDIKKSLSKIPPAHRKLASGYKVVFEPNNTLKGDDGHVGMLVQDGDKKVIRVAAPWNYGREFAFLHELAHLVWAAYVQGSPLEKQWTTIVQATPNKKKGENPEEWFAHGYADTYAKNKILIHHHDTWEKFIRELPS